MLFILFSVLSSTLLGFAFKLFPRYGVHTFQAIVVNYIVCVLCGWVSLGQWPVDATVSAQPWFLYAIVLGVIFVSTFNFAAFTFQQFGLTVGSVMQKMSIVISVIWFIIFYQESTHHLKLIGIALAIAAIWLTNLSPRRAGAGNQQRRPTWMYLFPALTLLLSGVIEILLFKVERMNASPADIRFISTLFGIAGLSGLAVMMPALLTKRLIWQWRNLIAGTILGIPNFLSIYFLMKSMGIGLEGSVVFPVNNVAIIAFSTLGAVYLFGEKLSQLNKLGVFCAIAAITLIALAANL